MMYLQFRYRETGMIYGTIHAHGLIFSRALDHCNVCLVTLAVAVHIIRRQAAMVGTEQIRQIIRNVSQWRSGACQMKPLQTDDMADDEVDGLCGEAYACCSICSKLNDCRTPRDI